MGNDRRRAIALRAADAKGVINLALPNLLKNMTYAQIQQVQRVLDAAVVNPAVQKQYQDLYEKSIVARSGGLVLQDPNKARRADRVAESLIQTSEADRRIMLNFEALLAPNALTSTTGNPDEAAYLKTVREKLKTLGVWLRVHQPHFRDPRTPSNHITDPRRWEVYLSLGSNGDKIQTTDGQITRENLLKLDSIGAGYYRRVYQGPVLTTLDREIKRLQRDIQAGEDQHNMMAKIRTEGPVQVSERLGRADFPTRSIWNQPRALMSKAWDMKIAGNVSGCQAYLVVAAFLTRNSARAVAEYMDDMNVGGERAVLVLRVVRTAAEIVDIALLATSGVGALRGAMGLKAPKEVVEQYVRKNPKTSEDLIQWIRGPKGTVSGGRKTGAGSGAGTGWHKW